MEKQSLKKWSKPTLCKSTSLSSWKEMSKGETEQHLQCRRGSSFFCGSQVVSYGSGRPSILHCSNQKWQSQTSFWQWSMGDFWIKVTPTLSWQGSQPTPTWAVCCWHHCKIKTLSQFFEPYHTVMVVVGLTFTVAVDCCPGTACAFFLCGISHWDSNKCPTKVKWKCDKLQLLSLPKREAAVTC